MIELKTSRQKISNNYNDLRAVLNERFQCNFNERIPY